MGVIYQMRAGKWEPDFDPGRTEPVKSEAAMSEKGKNFFSSDSMKGIS